MNIVFAELCQKTTKSLTYLSYAFSFFRSCILWFVLAFFCSSVLSCAFFHNIASGGINMSQYNHQFHCVKNISHSIGFEMFYSLIGEPMPSNRITAGLHHGRDKQCLLGKLLIFITARIAKNSLLEINCVPNTCPWDGRQNGLLLRH